MSPERATASRPHPHSCRHLSRSLATAYGRWLSLRTVGAGLARADGVRRSLLLSSVVLPLLALTALAEDRACPECSGAMIRLELGDTRSHHLCRFCPTVLHMEADGRTRITTRRSGRRTRLSAWGSGSDAQMAPKIVPAKAVAAPGRIVAPVTRPGQPISRPSHSVGRPAHAVGRPSHSILRPAHPITFRSEQQGAIVMIGTPVRRPAHSVMRPGHAIGRPAHAISRPAHPVERPTHAVSRPGHAVSRPGHPIARPDKATVAVRTRSTTRNRAGAQRKNNRARKENRRRKNKRAIKNKNRSRSRSK